MYLYVYNVHAVMAATDARLAEGSHACEGLLQFLLPVVGEQNQPQAASDKLEWVDGCSHQFGQSEAEVVCRQLGCDGGVRIHPRMYMLHNIAIV